MRKTIVILIVSYVLVSVAAHSLCAADESQNAQATLREIGIDQILFAPSALISAVEDDFMISAYLRTKTKEGDVPDNFSDTLDNAERFLVLRSGRWGAIFGWSGEANDKFFEPSILSVDYKYPLPYVKDNAVFSVDFKYSTKKLPKSDMRSSLLDFGVFSISGLASKEFSSIFELYGGVTANYIYLDARAEELTDLWRFVPFAGIRINVSPRHAAQIVSEISRGRIDSSADPMWNWNLGIAMGF